MKVFSMEKLIRSSHVNWRGALIVFGFLFGSMWLVLPDVERHVTQVTYTVVAQKQAPSQAEKPKSP